MQENLFSFLGQFLLYNHQKQGQDEQITYTNSSKSKTMGLAWYISHFFLSHSYKLYDFSNKSVIMHTEHTWNNNNNYHPN